MKGDSRGKAGFLGAALYAAAVLFLPFVRYRPNRILTGDAYRLHELAAGGLPAFLLLLALAGAFVFLRLKGGRFQALLAFLCALSLLAALAWCASRPGNPGENARISIGSGFFAGMAAALLMIFDAGRGGKAGWAVPALLAVSAGLLLSGAFDALSVMREYQNRRELFFSQSGRHLALAATSTLAAAALGIPLSFLLFSRKRLEKPVYFLVNIAQTIPTLSLLGLLMAPLAWLGSNSGLLKSWGVSGVGFWPAWIALFLYALFPILNNTLAGLGMADPVVTLAASSLGMNGRQVFLKVQLPLAVPLILGGVRTAMTQGMGNAILAALIGGGGLGSFIFLGLAQSAPDLILLGTIPLIALTLALDALLGGAARLTKRGARRD